MVITDAWRRNLINNCSRFCSVVLAACATMDPRQVDGDTKPDVQVAWRNS
jgi:hypothetical protein